MQNTDPIELKDVENPDSNLTELTEEEMEKIKGGNPGGGGGTRLLGGGSGLPTYGG